jgi:hypothetical protein
VAAGAELPVPLADEDVEPGADEEDGALTFRSLPLPATNPM